MLAIRLPEDIEHRLEILAKITGRSKTFYAKQAILEHLDDMEEVFLAEKSAEEIRAGKIKPISLEEMRRRLDLDN
ncbi:MAG: TraY domain-containing protein [Gammaproteobacteria bacterium]|nr:TraY domain-containing protein [Gammaproteobacteria bacterium]